MTTSFHKVKAEINRKVLFCYRKNSSIEFELDSFATECAWDHLYIYDGLSIYDPLIAALRYLNYLFNLNLCDQTLQGSS